MIKLIYEPPETEPLNSRFEEAGYDSSDFILSLGMFLIILIAIHLVYIFKKFGKMIFKRLKNNFFTKYLRTDNHYMSIVLRFFVEASIEIGITALICIKV